MSLPIRFVHPRQERVSRKTAAQPAQSASQPITAGALPSAVSGSLSPWPVSTQTTVSGAAPPSATGSPWARIPATEAAEAGSQKTPSREASSR